MGGDRRAYVDVGDIRRVITGKGVSVEDIAPPEHPTTLVLKDGGELEVFGLNAVDILFAMKAAGRYAESAFLIRNGDQVAQLMPIGAT